MTRFPAVVQPVKLKEQLWEGSLGQDDSDETKQLWTKALHIVCNRKFDKAVSDNEG